MSSRVSHCQIHWIILPLVAVVMRVWSLCPVRALWVVGPMFSVVLVFWVGGATTELSLSIIGHRVSGRTSVPSGVGEA